MKRGFSFVEVMVVIAIVLVLAAIISSVIVSSKSKARESVCISQLHQVGIAMTAYSEQHDGHLPQSNKLVGLLPTLSTWELLMCPQDAYRKGANPAATYYAKRTISYVIVSIVGPEALQEMNAIDPMHGLAICYVHGKQTAHFASGGANPLSDFEGPILRVRTDTSVSKFLPRTNCFDQGTTRLARGMTVWDLFTDQALPKKFETDLTGGMNIVPCTD